jgi:hypothetical protein
MDDETTGTSSTSRIDEETSVLGDWRSTQVEEDEPRTGMHPLQTGYLVAGLLAIGAALLWLLMDQGVVEVGDGGVAWSVVLITAGAIGLVASLSRAARRS